MSGHAITCQNQDGDACTVGDGMGPIDFETCEG